MIYRFERRGRRPATVLAVAAVWAGLLVLYITLDMAPWIVLFLAAFSLPAVWDLIRNPSAVLEVWPKRIIWASPLGSGDRSDVDHVRLNRRFDGAFKVTLVHVGGATTRLPPDIAAPITAFEDALKQAGIPAQRHPFSPI